MRRTFIGRFKQAFVGRRLRNLAFTTLIASGLAAPAVGQAREGYSDEETMKPSIARPIVETQTRNADGYEGWGFLGSAGAEIRWKRTTSMLLGTINTEDKIDVHNGTTVGIDLNSYFNFTRHFYAGGGVTGGKLWTSDYSKQSYHPYIGGGVGYSGWTGTVDYLLAGTDSSNGVRGWRIGWSIPIVKHRMYWVQTWSFYNSYPTDCPTCARENVKAMSMGMRYRF